MPSQTTTYDHRTTFILNLLRSNTKDAVAQVAALVPYKRLPAAKDRIYSTGDLLDRVAAKDRPTSFERRVASHVFPRPHGRPGWTQNPNPRLDEIKAGRTVAQMICRGVTMDDIKLAVEQGWLVLT